MTTSTRTRTHPGLKWLANERAALSGELLEIERQMALLQGKRAQTESMLHSMDETIRRFDASLDPTRIRPVQATTERYGGRGHLQRTLARLIADAGPEGISSRLLAPLAVAELGLPLASRAEVERWWRQRGRSAARKLAAAGRVGSQVGTDGITVWRAAAYSL